MCKDTRIDEHLDTVLNAGIDLYVAGLVHHRHEVSELDKRARRICQAGSVPVAIASAAGASGPGHLDCAGCSGIWDRDGVSLARAGDTPGEVVTTMLKR